MLSIIIACVVLTALIIGSITDIKVREVPDWVNFSLVPLGLGIRLIWSLATNDWSFIVYGLVGFAVFFALALIMFYTGQWGGGDSKMLIGLGALMGLDFNIKTELLSFLVNLVIAGSVYGLIWSIVLVLRNKKKFMLELKKLTRSIIVLRKIMFVLFAALVIGVILVNDALIRLMLVSLIVVIYSGFYLIIFIKAAEKSCMLKYAKPTEITEGDWIAEDVFIDGKRISGPKDLGIDRKNLNQLINFYKKGKINKVLIKVGIPFVPSFLIAYIITLIFGNLLLLII